MVSVVGSASTVTDDEQLHIARAYFVCSTTQAIQSKLVALFTSLPKYVDGCTQIWLKSVTENFEPA